MGLKSEVFESQGETGESGKVRWRDAAWCNMRKLQGAMFVCHPLRFFLIILGETEPDGEVDTNVLGESGMDCARADSAGCGAVVAVSVP